MYEYTLLLNNLVNKNSLFAVGGAKQGQRHDLQTIADSNLIPYQISTGWLAESSSSCSFRGEGKPRFFPLSNGNFVWKKESQILQTAWHHELILGVRSVYDVDVSERDQCLLRTVTMWQFPIKCCVSKTLPNRVEQKKRLSKSTWNWISLFCSNLSIILCRLFFLMAECSR